MPIRTFPSSSTSTPSCSSVYRLSSGTFIRTHPPPADHQDYRRSTSPATQHFPDVVHIQDRHPVIEHQSDHSENPSQIQEHVTCNPAGRQIERRDRAVQDEGGQLAHVAHIEFLFESHPPPQPPPGRPGNPEPSLSPSPGSAGEPARRPANRSSRSPG